MFNQLLTVTQAGLLQIGLPQIDGYRNVRALESGVHTQVMLALRLRDQAPVALKLLPRQAVSAEQGGDAHDQSVRDPVLQNFLQECALLATLDSRHIVSLLDQGFGEHHCWFTMEYLSGGTLRDALHTGFPPTRALAYLEQIALALDALDSRAIVHRDIRPDNFLLRANGELVLADFSIALHGAFDFGPAPAGELRGAAPYLSPEQVLGGRADARSDLYSAGVTFFEMLTGHTPYKSNRPAATLEAHLRAPVPRLPGALIALQPLVEALLAKAPDERIANARALYQLAVSYRATAQGVNQNGAGYPPHDSLQTANDRASAKAWPAPAPSPPAHPDRPAGAVRAAGIAGLASAPVPAPL